MANWVQQQPGTWGASDGLRLRSPRCREEALGNGAARSCIGSGQRDIGADQRQLARRLAPYVVFGRLHARLRGQHLVDQAAYRSAVSRVIQTLITVVFLLVFISAADGIPSVDDELYQSLTILDVIRLATPVVLVVLVWLARDSSRDILAWFGAGALKARSDPARAPLWPAISDLAGNITNIAAITLTWLILWPAANLLTDEYPDYDWALTISVLVFVALLLLAFLVTYRSLTPLLDAPTLSPATGMDTFDPAAEVGVNCANCGVTNPIGNSFCQACGQPLEEQVPPTDQPVDGIACRTCGKSVATGLAFCTGCGTAVEA